MIARLIRSILRDRRGATALIIALMSVPLIITSGAAVDFSRMASARAQLQSAVDAAALAGAGAYQVNGDGVIAYNVANTAFNTAVTNLKLYATVSNAIGTSCDPGGTYVTTTTCGTTRSPNGATTLCPSTTAYCVEVTAQATLQNSLLAIVIPSDVLNVTGVAQDTGSGSVSSGNLYHIGNGYGSDAVQDNVTPQPQDSAGNPVYGSPTAPNTYCQTPAYGLLQYLPSSTPAKGQTGCNYVVIGTNSGTSGSGNFGFSNTDPLDFTLDTFTGGNITSGTSDLDTTTLNTLNGASTINALNAPTPYFNELYVTVAGVTTYYATSTPILGITAYAYCPAHNLYGSIIAYPNSTNDIVPYQDSINVFSSSWEVVGYPPTHGTNHALLPFLGPANTTITGLLGASVRAVCPQWPTTGTNINATTTFTPSSLNAAVYAPVTSTAGFPSETVKIYSTYYPDATYTDSNGIYPPAIAGCTPATDIAANGGMPDGSVTPTKYNPWWGWSPYNNLQGDPGGAAENPGPAGAVTNCTSTVVNSTAGVTTTRNVTQTPTYNDCTFIIQPLGTAVPINATTNIPNLPDYYTYTVVSNAFNTGITGNPSSITAITPVYDGYNGDTRAKGSGYVPTAVSITGSNPYTVTEPPAYGRDDYPPEDTSHQCYNPQANGLAAISIKSGQINNDYSGIAIDPVENPQLGAVLCNSTPAQSFAIYWNDMGAYSNPPRYNDDLGYANAFTEFTCPTPGSPGGSGPPALID